MYHHHPRCFKPANDKPELIGAKLQWKRNGNEWLLCLDGDAWAVSCPMPNISACSGLCSQAAGSATWPISPGRKTRCSTPQCANSNGRLVTRLQLTPKRPRKTAVFWGAQPRPCEKTNGVSMTVPRPFFGNPGRRQHRATAPVQLDLFIATESVVESASTLLGLSVRLDRPSDRDYPCHSNICVIGAARKPHAGELLCAICGRHRGWISKSTARWIASVIGRFGAPATPIIVRKSHICEEA